MLHVGITLQLADKLTAGHSALTLETEVKAHTESRCAATSKVVTCLMQANALCML